MPHGTTGMFIDPHEIANVFGLRGVRLMVDEAAIQPIHVWVQMPSCVPSAPGLETPGASSTGRSGRSDDLAGHHRPGRDDELTRVWLPATRRCTPRWRPRAAPARSSAGITPRPTWASFHAYAAGGPKDDHEGTRLEDAVARVRQGMKAMLRYGSAWHDVAEQVRAITEMGLDPRHSCCAPTTSHSATLVDEGHVDRVVRHAISRGCRR